MIEIDDPDDPRVAMFRVRDRGLNTRADRRESVAAGMFVAEGDLVVGRALDAQCVAVAALVDSERPPSVMHRFAADVPVYAGSEAVRRTNMGLGVPLSVIALFRRPTPLPASTLVGLQRLVAVEAIDNPVNVGTIVRTAVALGWNGLLLDRTSADPLARRALRVSMGNAFSLPFARSDSLIEAISAARNVGALVVALTPDATAVPLDTLRPALQQQVILLLGSERAGLSSSLLEAASVRAAIPMQPGVDSLNAAAAAAIACYELRPNRP